MRRHPPPALRDTARLHKPFRHRHRLRHSVLARHRLSAQSAISAQDQPARGTPFKANVARGISQHALIAQINPEAKLAGKIGALAQCLIEFCG